MIGLLVTVLPCNNLCVISLLMFVYCIQPNRLKHGVVIQRHMNDICSRDSEVCELLKTCVDQLQHVSVYALCTTGLF